MGWGGLTPVYPMSEQAPFRLAVIPLRYSAFMNCVVHPSAPTLLHKEGRPHRHSKVVML